MFLNHWISSSNVPIKLWNLNVQSIQTFFLVMWTLREHVLWNKETLTGFQNKTMINSVAQTFTSSAEKTALNIRWTKTWSFMWDKSELLMRRFQAVRSNFLLGSKQTGNTQTRLQTVERCCWLAAVGQRGRGLKSKVQWPSATHNNNPIISDTASHSHYLLTVITSISISYKPLN